MASNVTMYSVLKVYESQNGTTSAMWIESRKNVPKPMLREEAEKTIAVFTASADRIDAETRKREGYAKTDKFLLMEVSTEPKTESEAPSPDLERGHVVRLKSGGPAMTVLSLEKNNVDGVPFVKCGWFSFDKDGRQVGDFQTISVTRLALCVQWGDGR
jgi:uncharacterized protein YodC (DUF2158 family)